MLGLGVGLTSFALKTGGWNIGDPVAAPNAEAVPPVFALFPYYSIAATQTVGDWIADRLSAEPVPPVFAIAPYAGVAIY